MGTSPETLTVENGIWTFTTRKMWEELPETALLDLTRHEISLAFKTNSSFCLLLRSTDPINCHKKTRDMFLLARLSIDEDGKLKIHVMELSADEARILEQNRAEVWE